MRKFLDWSRNYILLAQNNKKDNRTVRKRNIAVTPPAQRLEVVLGERGRAAGSAVRARGFQGQAGRPQEKPLKPPYFQCGYFPLVTGAAKKGLCRGDAHFNVFIV